MIIMQYQIMKLSKFVAIIMAKAELLLTSMPQNCWWGGHIISTVGCTTSAVYQQILLGCEIHYICCNLGVVYGS